MTKNTPLISVKKAISRSIFAIIAIASPWISFQHLQAQSKKIDPVKTINRVEFDMKDGYSQEEVINLGKAGVVMVSRAEKVENGTFDVHYEFFNSDIKSTDEFNESVDKAFSVKQGLIGNAAIYNHISLQSLTHFTNFIYNKNGEYQIHTFEKGSKHKLTVAEGHLPKKSSIISATLVGKNLFVCYQIKKSIQMANIDWKSGEAQLILVNIPGTIPKKLMYRGIQPIENIEEVSLFMEQKITKTTSNFYSVRYNMAGDMVTVIDLNKTSTNQVIDITVSAVAKNKVFYTGTYSTKGGSNGLTAEGIFLAESDGTSLSYIRYTNFLDLKNYTKYLPQKQKAKIEKQKDKAAARGKELSASTLMVTHPIIPVSDGFILLGEAYYPTYRTEQRTTYVNGKPTTTVVTVFDGYQYTHAILVKFNLKGEIVQDQSMSMYLIRKPMGVERNITISTSEPLTMTFADYNYIRSTTFDNNGNSTASYDRGIIGTGDETEKVKQTVAKIGFLYENYYVIHGFQRIKGSGGKRNVYFISKVQI